MKDERWLLPQSQSLGFPVVPRGSMTQAVAELDDAALEVRIAWAAPYARRPLAGQATERFVAKQAGWEGRGHSVKRVILVRDPHTHQISQHGGQRHQ